MTEKKEPRTTWDDTQASIDLDRCEELAEAVSGLTQLLEDARAKLRVARKEAAEWKAKAEDAAEGALKKGNRGPTWMDLEAQVKDNARNFSLTEIEMLREVSRHAFAHWKIYGDRESMDAFTGAIDRIAKIGGISR